MALVSGSAYLQVRGQLHRHVAGQHSQPWAAAAAGMPGPLLLHKLWPAGQLADERTADWALAHTDERLWATPACQAHPLRQAPVCYPSSEQVLCCLLYALQAACTAWHLACNSGMLSAFSVCAGSVDMCAYSSFQGLS